MTQVISLKALLDAVLPAIKLALKKKVELTIESSDESISMDIDLIQMRTAVLAIINNADEAIVDQGDIRICSRLYQWDHLPEKAKDELDPGDYVCIRFEDNGTGMDGDTLRRLFEPFFSTKFEGRGLSMATVAGIIKNHNGWISASSEIGQGTTVHIYLPQC
jgi:signal transduction histidine kinase